MLAKLKRRLGANGPGITIAVLAMLVALTGGAFAAGGALSGKQKKEVEKIAKKFAGKPGAQGAQGATGATGAKGDKGDAGGAGSEGKPGKSVKVTSIASGGIECEEDGGALVKEEGAVSGIEVCNGKEGKDGSPWAPENALPPGATETGAWTFAGTTSDAAGIRVPISFPVQLGPGQALDEEHVHFVEAPTEPCPGTAGAPLAEPGQLCVYVSNLGVVGTEFLAIERATDETVGANRTGAVLTFKAPTGNASASGTFALRAAEP